MKGVFKKLSKPGHLYNFQALVGDCQATHGCQVADVSEVAKISQVLTRNHVFMTDATQVFLADGSEVAHFKAVFQVEILHCAHGVVI